MHSIPLEDAVNNIDIEIDCICIGRKLRFSHFHVTAYRETVGLDNFHVVGDVTIQKSSIAEIYDTYPVKF